MYSCMVIFYKVQPRDYEVWREYNNVYMLKKAYMAWNNLQELGLISPTLTLHIMDYNKFLLISVSLWEY